MKFQKMEKEFREKWRIDPQEIYDINLENSLDCEVLESFLICDPNGLFYSKNYVSVWEAVIKKYNNDPDSNIDKIVENAFLNMIQSIEKYDSENKYRIFKSLDILRALSYGDNFHLRIDIDKLYELYRERILPYRDELYKVSYDSLWRIDNYYWRNSRI